LPFFATTHAKAAYSIASHIISHHLASGIWHLASLHTPSPQQPTSCIHQVLHLVDCNISSDGLAALAEALSAQPNPALQQLYVSRSMMSELNSALRFADVYKRNTTLRWILPDPDSGAAWPPLAEMKPLLQFGEFNRELWRAQALYQHMIDTRCLPSIPNELVRLVVSCLVAPREHRARKQKAARLAAVAD
jgi:hypothetical protein